MVKGPLTSRRQLASAARRRRSGLADGGGGCDCVCQLAMTAEIYVHRSGRTARAGKDGLSIVLVVPAERSRSSCANNGKGALNTSET
eukprot:6903800-Pyramimonas_sp.AAC.1